MVILLEANGTPTVRDLWDFARFHCEIDAAFPTPSQAQARFGGLAEVESQETAWVDLASFLNLGAAQAEPRSQEWRDAALVMVNKAAKFGWVRDQPAAIKSHIIWRA